MEKMCGGVSNASSWSDLRIYAGYIYNVSVEGSNNIGGVVGCLYLGRIDDMYIETNVKAYSSSAGGVIGYLQNDRMTSASYQTSFYRVIVLDSTVTAPTKAGGLIGDIATEIYRDKSFYYDNYIDADITIENESTGSLIIGGRPDENPYITNTYVYKYSTLNGNYVYASDDNIEDEQVLVRADLENQNTYSSTIGLGTTYWDYTSLQEEKYPTIKDSYLYLPELQTGVDLPTDPSIVELNSIGTEDENDTVAAEPNSNDISTQSIKALPEVTVYPISVNEINMDFSDISNNISFIYYINGNEIEKVDLTEKTYTFEYNFEDQLEIVVTNGIDEETITINPSEIRSEMSLVGENNAYLIGSNLYINGELQQGEYVNIYSGYALSSSGKVIDISTLQVINGEIVETSLKESVKPIYTYEYNGNDIEVYGTYSKIDGNIKLQIYNIRSGKLSALSNSLDMKIDNYIVDSYNDKEYQTILTNSGEIVDLKEQLQYPDNFLSRNVKQIVQNSNADNTEMMVLYNTGKVIVFNYVNGNIVYENSEQADSGLANYITGSINSIWSDYESKQSEYLRSKALIARLVEMPIEEVLNEVEDNESTTNQNNSVETINNVNISNINDTYLNTSSNEDSYITVYNGETGEYEVYSESEILGGEEEQPVSETEKIKANGLEGIYNYEKEEERGTKVNGAIIVVSIIGIAIISLIILRKIIYKNNQKNNK